MYSHVGKDVGCVAWYPDWRTSLVNLKLTSGCFNRPFNHPRKWVWMRLWWTGDIYNSYRNKWHSHQSPIRQQLWQLRLLVVTHRCHVLHIFLCVSLVGETLSYLWNALEDFLVTSEYQCLIFPQVMVHTEASSVTVRNAAFRPAGLYVYYTYLPLAFFSVWTSEDAFPMRPLPKNIWSHYYTSMHSCRRDEDI